jgi:hypothetical protein
MAASVMTLLAKVLPIAERLVGRDEQESAFMAGGDQLEHHTGLGLIVGNVGDVVEDQQVVLVEFGDGGFEPQLPARHDPVARDRQTGSEKPTAGGGAVGPATPSLRQPAPGAFSS